MEKQTKTEKELSKLGIEGDDVWIGLEIQNEELVDAMQQLKETSLRSFHFKNFYAMYKNHTLFLVEIIIKHSVYHRVFSQ